MRNERTERNQNEKKERENMNENKEPTIKHTPGPWEADTLRVWAGTKANLVYIASLKFVSDTGLPDSDTGLPDDESLANAALIAAAPDTAAERDRLKAQNAELVRILEAALERMEAVSERIGVEHRSEGVSQRAHVGHMAAHLGQHAKIARADLAKAKGLA